MLIKICEHNFDPWQEIEQFQNSCLHQNRNWGANCIFIGTMRDFNDGNQVQRLTLEHYSGMTENQLQKIIQEAQRQWNIIETLVIHRVGELLPTDPIVLVAVWSSHRGDAFDACRHIMEALKSRAPFWKKEHLPHNRSRWVKTNTTGYLKN